MPGDGRSWHSSYPLPIRVLKCVLPPACMDRCIYWWFYCRLDFPRGAKQPQQFWQVEGRRWRWARKCSHHATPYRVAWKNSRMCRFSSCWHLFHWDKWQLLPGKSLSNWVHPPTHSPLPTSIFHPSWGTPVGTSQCLLSSVVSATLFITPALEGDSVLCPFYKGRSEPGKMSSLSWVMFVTTHRETRKSSGPGGRGLVYEWQEMPGLTHCPTTSL